MLKRAIIVLALACVGLCAVLIVIDLASSLLFCIFEQVKYGSEEQQIENNTKEYRCDFKNGIIFAGIRLIVGWHAEVWIALGTIIIAIFTVILGTATIFLWRATRDLVESAEITAKRQLRAYIGHQPNGCIWFPRLPDGVGFKYAEMNHGKTPAYDVELNVRLTETAPDDRYGGPFCRLPVMKMIHPKQEIGTAIFIRSITDIHPFRPDRVFFLYGYVDYKDCFEQKWRRRFAFRHNAVVLGMGYEEWDARPDHNDELKREGDGPWPT